MIKNIEDLILQWQFAPSRITAVNELKVLKDLIFIIDNNTQELRELQKRIFQKMLSLAIGNDIMCKITQAVYVDYAEIYKAVTRAIENLEKYKS